jgi:hypothetical protein
MEEIEIQISILNEKMIKLGLTIDSFTSNGRSVSYDERLQQIELFNKWEHLNIARLALLDIFNAIKSNLKYK